MSLLERISVDPQVRFGKPCVCGTRSAPPKVEWLNIGNAPNAMTVTLLRSHAATIDAFAEQSEATFLALGLGENAA